MMFQWANKQLEKLSETLAPPPSTPAHRYLAAVASHQEDVALSILNDPHEPLDPYSSLNQKGMNALHAAASHGIVNIMRQLIGRGVRVDIADYNGWTALHHAAASSSMSAQSALATVKVLVEELGASVVMKDATAQTPYDVGSSQAVRGYLLPKQLQKETQECLDNGGAGLMPGIDLGGMKVNYNNLAPPPVIGTPGGAPPQPSMMKNNDPSTALMQPPPVRGMNSNLSPQPPVANNYNAAAACPAMMQPMSSPMPGHNNISQPDIPPPSNNTVDVLPQQDNQTTSFPEQAPIQTPNQPPQLPNQPPVENSNQAPQQLHQQTSHYSANHVTSAEQPPKSNNSTASASSASEYALRGGNSNSAFVLNESSYASSGRKLYKPDGFHTSSNDKELQAKYGHVENTFETSRKAAVPPPPTSANGMASPPPHSGGTNPYSAMGAGNVRTMGYIGGGGRARYPAYCAVSDSVSAPPSLGGQGFSPQMERPPATSYSTFNPGAMQQNTAVATAGPTQQWSGEQQMQNMHVYTSNQYAAPAVQTQQWSGENQTQNYAQSNVSAPSPNVAPSYVGTSQQTNIQNQHSTSGYQHAQPQTIATTDGNADAALGAASMFATPHAEDKKAMFPSTGETASTNNASDVFSFPPPPAESNTAETKNTADLFASPPPAIGSANETNNTIDVFSSPPPSESNAVDLKQQQSANNAVIPPELTVSAPQNEQTPVTEDASSFFGVPSESNAPKAFGGLPPPPVFGSNNTTKPLSAPSKAGGTSSLPPPPMLKSFSNQTPNNAVPAEDEIPTEQFADVSL
ncbi:hypothetical protein ACHAWT_009535 [Skeletonema menzelii]